MRCRLYDAPAAPQGTIDEWGHMQITDRSKDVIKSGGEWISSIEIENLAVGHPQVGRGVVDRHNMRVCR